MTKHLEDSHVVTKIKNSPVEYKFNTQEAHGDKPNAAFLKKGHAGPESFQEGE